MSHTFFKTPAEFRAWLEAHHRTEKELLVGFYKKGSGHASITWPESVDEALCFGWIDGIRRRIDDVSYSIRFTPRRKESVWSSVNIARVEELAKLGLMRPAGIEAFERRKPEKSGIYAYEQRIDTLDAATEKEFRKHKSAWTFFQSQPASYRKSVTWWVMNGKKEETRMKRLATAIEHSAAGETVPQFTRYRK
jgi:uncharacterized protein YdeI (YjbR/CyaY-like superfamily)